MFKSLTTPDIEKLIPHRAPMLLVSRVENFEADNWIETSHTFHENSPFFQGHFPGNPILPGIIMLESMAQSAALLTSLSKNLTAESAGYLFAAVKDVVFKNPLTPGQTFCMRVEKSREKLGILSFTGRGEVDGILSCQASFTAKLIVKKS